jgi:hypothetical protein
VPGKNRKRLKDKADDVLLFAGRSPKMDVVGEEDEQTTSAGP